MQMQWQCMLTTRTKDLFFCPLAFYVGLKLPLDPHIFFIQWGVGILSHMLTTNSLRILTGLPVLNNILVLIWCKKVVLSLPSMNQ